MANYKHFSIGFYYKNQFLLTPTDKTCFITKYFITNLQNKQYIDMIDYNHESRLTPVSGCHNVPFSKNR